MQRFEGGSREAEKFIVRFPPGMRGEVERVAVAGDTSMNTVMIRALRMYLHGQERQELLLDALAKAAVHEATKADQEQQS